MTKAEMINEIMDILKWLCDRAMPDESGIPESATIHCSAFSISDTADTKAVL